jgi:gluconate 2-dehydrogenase gamma chain
MNRREALQQAAWLMGGAISAPAILGILNGRSAQAKTSAKPQFLSEAQMAVVAEIVDIFIPRTETPGGKDVGVPEFIDMMMKAVYPSDDQERFLTGLKAFDADANKVHGKGFLQLNPAQRIEHVRKFHDPAVVEERAMNGPAQKLHRPFILMTKELTLLGFFTSKVGATQVLQYSAIPGSFHACVPLAQAGNGRNWAFEQSTRF